MVLKIYLPDDVYDRIINGKDVYGDDEELFLSVREGEQLTENEVEDEA